MKLAIVVGHNEKYQGATGINGVTEYEFNSELAQDLRDVLILDGVNVEVFYREPIRSYRRQIDLLNMELREFRPDLTIELHFNASIDTDVEGHEVLYCKKSRRGKHVAQIFDKLYDRWLRNKDRNIKGRNFNERGGRFLCTGREPRVILEPFFASHIDEYDFGSKGYHRLVRANRYAILNSLAYLAKD